MVHLIDRAAALYTHRTMVLGNMSLSGTQVLQVGSGVTGLVDRAFLYMKQVVHRRKVRIKLFIQGVGRMFYLATPAQTSFPDTASLPEPYLAQAAPLFFGLIVLEWSILLMKGEKIRLNDGLLSVVHGLIMSLME